MDTKTQLIGGGTLAVIALGIAAYLIYKKEIGKTVEGVGSAVTNAAQGASEIPQAIGNIAGTTANVVKDVTSPITIIRESSDTINSILDFAQQNINAESNRSLLRDKERDKSQVEVGANQGKGDVKTSEEQLNRTTTTEKEKTLRNTDTQKALTTANKTIIEATKNAACNLPFVKDTSLCKTSSLKTPVSTSTPSIGLSSSKTNQITSSLGSLLKSAGTQKVQLSSSLSNLLKPKSKALRA